jgi:hypothetical protein
VLETTLEELRPEMPEEPKSAPEAAAGLLTARSAASIAPTST